MTGSYSLVKLYKTISIGLQDKDFSYEFDILNRYFQKDPALPDFVIGALRLNAKTKLLETPKGSKAKPKIQVLDGDTPVAEIGARKTAYRDLIQFVDETPIAGRIEKQDSVQIGSKFFYKLILIYKTTDFDDLADDEIIVIDTETTGVELGNDEVLSLSILNGSGDVLFSDLIKPQFKDRWYDAEGINGITPISVMNKRTLKEIESEIRPFFDNAKLIVGYNVGFDIGMLETNGFEVGQKKAFDVMRAYAEMYSPDGSFIKLVDCAKAYDFSFKPHHAEEDCKATLYIFKKMQEGVPPKQPEQKKEVKKSDEAGMGCVFFLVLFIFLLIALMLLFGII